MGKSMINKTCWSQIKKYIRANTILCRVFVFIPKLPTMFKISEVNSVYIINVEFYKVCRVMG